MDVEENVVDKLYAIFNKIKENQSAGKSSENPALFEKILAGAASDAGAESKRLSAQFICRLFASLTAEHQKAAYNALIDLVEEDDAQTRKQVISGLPRLCQGADSGHVSKVADVLVQLMQTDDELELSLVQHSLLQVLNCNALEAVDGIFGQINHEDVAETARLRAIKFLADRLLSVDRRQMTAKVEEAIAQQVDAALEDVSEEEFVHFVRVLASLQCMQTLGGRQRLVDMMCAQANLAAEFDPADAACVGRVRGCARQALPFLSRNIIATKFVAYFLDKVLPALGRLQAASADDQARLDLLRHFAELSGHAGPHFVATDAQIASLLCCINSVMPLPQDEAGAASQPAAGAEKNLNFSEAECLLLALHHVGRTRPGYFAERPAELIELKKRLQHFQLANQSYQKSLKSVLDSKQQPQQQQQQTPTSASQRVQTALATTANVGQLIRELFKHPQDPFRGLAAAAAAPSDPTAATTLTVLPSWRRHRAVRPPPLPNQQQAPAQASSSQQAGGSQQVQRKRRSDAPDLPTYRPPAGKYSAIGAPAPAPARYGGRSRYYNVYTRQKRD